MERTEERMNQIEDLIRRVNQTNEGVVNMLARQDETQPTILRKLNLIEAKVDLILGREGTP